MYHSKRNNMCVSHDLLGTVQTSSFSSCFGYRQCAVFQLHIKTSTNRYLKDIFKAMLKTGHEKILLRTEMLPDKGNFLGLYLFIFTLVTIDKVQNS